jgi:cysteine desulfurase
MRRIYLDHASATSVDPRVLEFAHRFLSEDFGNPSTLHSFGLTAKRAFENARAKIADFINAESPGTIIFTGSATEANNLAIRGTALRNRKWGTHVLTSSIEHISVLNSARALQKQGFDTGLVPVDTYGILNCEALDEMVTSETTVTSVNYANDEIGTIEPVRRISEIVHETGRYFHMNATAAAGRIPIDVQADEIDLLTLSSGDLFGPRGAGTLYIKPGVKVQTILPGGGQERGLRSGTKNVLAIVGMGEAARLAGLEMQRESNRLRGIRDELIEAILEIEESYLTGNRTQLLSHHASFRFSRIEGESILLNLDTLFNIQVATGSACTSRTLEPSQALIAIGLKHEEAHGSMVMTLGPSNVPDDIPVIVDAVFKTVERLRKLSPL